VAMHAGATLAILEPTLAKGLVYVPSSPAKWSNAVDQGVYNGGGRAEGPMVAIAKVGLGKAAFIGDSSPIEDSTTKYLKEETGTAKTTYAGWQEGDDAVLVTRLVDWLAKQESYTSLDQVSGLTLDSATSLLAMENPATSTEPQAEPWATPAVGYKWWDPSTFKAGSYGYGSVTPASYVITASAGPGGTVSPAGSISVSAGGSQTFQITPSTGYILAGLTVDGVSQASTSSYTFSNVKANHSLSVSFIRAATTLSEGFEGGSKAAYGKGDVAFASGVWTLDDTLTGSSSADAKNGSQSLRMRNSGKATTYASDAASTWGLWYSSNGGSTWTQAGASVTSSSSALRAATFPVNVSGSLRFEIRKTDGSSRRLNLDDFQITSY